MKKIVCVYVSAFFSPCEYIARPMENNNEQQQSRLHEFLHTVLRKLCTCSNEHTHFVVS